MDDQSLSLISQHGGEIVRRLSNGYPTDQSEQEVLLVLALDNEFYNFKKRDKSKVSFLCLAICPIMTIFLLCKFILFPLHSSADQQNENGDYYHVYSYVHVHQYIIMCIATYMCTSIIVYAYFTVG